MERTRELSETLEQQTATAEVLRTIAKSPGDTAPVFAAIAANGLRIFNGRNIAVLLTEGGKLYRPAYVTRQRQGLDGAESLYPLALDHNELVLRAGAYENSLFVIGVAKCGKEDGVEFIAGSCICDPLGQVLAKAATTGDELITADQTLGDDDVIELRPVMSGGSASRAGLFA